MKKILGWAFTALCIYWIYGYFSGGPSNSDIPSFSGTWETTFKNSWDHEVVVKYNVIADGEQFRIETVGTGEPLGNGQKAKIQIYDGDTFYESHLANFYKYHLKGASPNWKTSTQDGSSASESIASAMFWVKSSDSRIKEKGPGDTVLGRETTKYEYCFGSWGCAAQHVDNESGLVLKTEGSEEDRKICTDINFGSVDESHFEIPSE